MAKHIIKRDDFVDVEELVDESGHKIAKRAIIYAALAVVAAAIFVPLGNTDPSKLASFINGDIDTTVTGSVGKPNAKRYRIHRSVLQEDPENRPCYIFPNGTRKGDC